MIEPATKKDLAKLKTDLIRTLVTWQLINVAMVFGTYALIVGLYLRYLRRQWGGFHLSCLSAPRILF
jgi:hypothetical protein